MINRDVSGPDPLNQHPTLDSHPQSDSGGLLIRPEPVSCLVPGSAVSPRAAERWSWALIWPSWRKRAIRVQLVQTEVK